MKTKEKSSSEKKILKTAHLPSSLGGIHFATIFPIGIHHSTIWNIEPKILKPIEPRSWYIDSQINKILNPFMTWKLHHIWMSLWGISPLHFTSYWSCNLGSFKRQSYVTHKRIFSISRELNSMYCKCDLFCVLLVKNKANE